MGLWEGWLVAWVNSEGLSQVSHFVSCSDTYTLAAREERTETYLMSDPGVILLTSLYPGETTGQVTGGLCGAIGPKSSLTRPSEAPREGRGPRLPIFVKVTDP